MTAFVLFLCIVAFAALLIIPPVLSSQKVEDHDEDPFLRPIE